MGGWSGAGEREEEEAVALLELTCVWKKDGTFPKLPDSFTQLIEKGYVWPAMIEGNVGTPQTKSKTGFTRVLTSVCWLVGCNVLDFTPGYQ